MADGAAACWALPARVTAAEVPALVATARAALTDAARGWRVDAAALDAFDSSCLALLLELRRMAGARTWSVVGAPPRLVQLAQAYGIEFTLNGQG